jgi:uncharacterized protein YkwD
MPAPTRVLLLLALLPGALLAAPAETDSDWTLRALQAINQTRQAQGLGVLQPSAPLQAIALDHSRAMAAQGRLSHAGFQARFDRTTSDLCVENVASGTTRPDTLVAAWQRAQQHRRNLYEPRLRWAGLAGVDGFVTLFACE